jgi:hypothetical protein
MARPRGGLYTKEASVPIATRLSAATHAKVLDATGERGVAPWLRDLVEGAVAGKVTGTGAAQTKGFAEGFRQGWSNGNAAFRKALRAALDELGGMPSG